MYLPLHIGTCAWSYDDWRGVFYPGHLPQSEWLAWYARHLPTVEIDSTFYSAPSLQTAAHWLDATPDHFRFTCKLPREITHERRLRDCSGQTRAFLDALAPLRAKLGPILIQLPPTFAPERDESALKEFIMELPRDFSFAVEFRHGDWHLPRIVRFFEQEKICWVWTDTTPLAMQNRAAFEFLPQTADCLYVRLLGDLAAKYHADGSRIHRRYHGIEWPRDASLESWAIKLQKHLADASCIYVFAGNHFEGFSPLTCQRFARLFGMSIALPELPIPEVKEVQKNQLDLF